jgi:hypothetical protein
VAREYGPRPTLSSTAPAPPEKSPLEPEGEYQRRLTKWRKDNAKWLGQRRAARKLGKPPSIRIPQPLVE